MTELHETARALVAEGKGILAADESSGTIAKRFAAIGVESTEESRRAYRDLLFTTPGAEEFISGVILFDETIRQRSADGTPFPELLARAGSFPGSRSTAGRSRWRSRRARPSRRASTGSGSGSRSTATLGARFAKWRATYSIGGGQTERVLRLGERARACPLRRARAGGGPRADRRAGGADGRHALDRRQRQGHRTGAAGALHRAPRPAGGSPRDGAEAEHGALGLRRGGARGVDEVAERTLEVLYRHVPAAVPGICFLSGGQTDEDATAHLNAMRPARAAPVAAFLLVRAALQAPLAPPGSAGARERRGGAARLLPSREDERRGANRHLHRRARSGGRSRWPRAPERNGSSVRLDERQRPLAARIHRRAGRAGRDRALRHQPAVPGPGAAGAQRQPRARAARDGRAPRRRRP